MLPANAKPTDASPNMFKSMRIPHIIGKCLGLLPVRGITSNSPQTLRFSWISLNTLYTLCYFAVAVYSLSTFLKLFFRSSVRIMHFCNKIFLIRNRATYLHFFLSVAVVLETLHVMVILAFLILSRGLGKLMQFWSKVDKAMNKIYGYPKGLDRRFKVFFVGFITISTVIALINVASVIRSYRKADGSVDFNGFIMSRAFRFSIKNRTAAYIAGIFTLVH